MVLYKLSILVGFVVLLAVSTEAQYPAQVKIMTYNINAETHTDGDYTDIGDVINAINPTICGLQKVDSCTVTAAPVYVLKALAQQANMTYTFSVSYTKNGGSYGNGFLSDSVPKSTRHLAIPKGSTGASEDRSALEIGITMGGEKVRVIVTHLDYSGATAQTAELQQIVPWIDSGGKSTDPVVIMADFNSGSTAAPMKVLTDAGFVYVKGTNGVILDTTNNINHILYRPETRWKIIDAGNPVYAASNRNPVWATMELLNTVPAIKETRPAGNNQPVNKHWVCGRTVRCELAEPATVSMTLYDATGAETAVLMSKQRLAAGAYSVPIDGKNVKSGMYFIVLKISGQIITDKALITN